MGFAGYGDLVGFDFCVVWWILVVLFGGLVSEFCSSGCLLISWLCCLLVCSVSW